MQPTSGGPRSIGGLVARLMARTGYDRTQAAETLAIAWGKAAPPAFRGASQPGLVRRGILEVFVTHPALVQEMGFCKREIVARLAELVPAEGITDIRCRVQADSCRDPNPPTDGVET